MTNYTTGLRSLCLWTCALAAVWALGAARAEETTTFDTTVNGQVVTNPDGSITVTKNRTTVNENNGNTVNAASVKNIQKTSDGTEWNRDTVRTNSNGGSATTQTSGSSVNNGNGTGSWSSVTNGEATHANGKESTWTTDRSGSWQDTATGKDFQRESDKTFNNGKTVDRQTTGTVTNTANGKDIVSTTTGEEKGPNGKEHDWTTTRNEQIVNNGNGTKSIDESITRTNADGKTTTIDKTGSLTNEGNGKFQYQGSKTVEKNAAPASAPAAAPKAIAAAPESTEISHAELHNRMDAFNKHLDNFLRSGRKLADHPALQNHFERLSKQWEANKHHATPELHQKFEGLRKAYEGTKK